MKEYIEKIIIGFGLNVATHQIKLGNIATAKPEKEAKGICEGNDRKGTEITKTNTS